MRLSPALAAALAASALTACAPRPSAPSAAGPAGEPSPGLVSGEAARTLVERGAVVVDVRTPQEFAAGHVPGAVNIPFDEIGRRAAEVGSPSSAVVLYCRSGRRSAIAGETLRGLGFEKVYDMQRATDWPTALQ